MMMLRVTNATMTRVRVRKYRGELSRTTIREVIDEINQAYSWATAVMRHDVL